MRPDARLWALLLAALAALAAIAGGCGDDDDDAGSTASADSYVSDMCTAISDMGTVISDGQDEIGQATDATPEEARDLLVSFFEDAGAAVESARGAIDDAGVPDVEDGEQVAGAISSAFAEMQTILEDGVSEAQELSTESIAEFNAAAQELGSTVETSGEQINESLQEVGDNEELSAAAQDSEACQGI